MSLVIGQRLAHTAATVDECPTTPERAAIDYAAFFRAEFAAVTRTAYLVLHDPDAAEDVAQDAFTQLHLHRAKISTCWSASRRRFSRSSTASTCRT